MDDVLIFGAETDLRALRPRCVERLDALGLCLKNGGVFNRGALGVPFLGFTLYPDRLRLNRGGRRRLRRRVGELERAVRRGEIGEAELSPEVLR